MKKPENCRIEPTDKGWRIRGECANELEHSFARIFDASEAISREISGYVCIDPHTQRVSEVGVYDVGTATETQIPSKRSCPCQESQISLHTHQLSGIAKFSRQDAEVVAKRINEGVEDGHCVLGLDEFLCVFGVKGKNKVSED